VNISQGLALFKAFIRLHMLGEPHSGRVPERVVNLIKRRFDLRSHGCLPSGMVDHDGSSFARLVAVPRLWGSGFANAGQVTFTETGRGASGMDRVSTATDAGILETSRPRAGGARRHGNCTTCVQEVTMCGPARGYHVRPWCGS
jgi:hypothetical protein